MTKNRRASPGVREAAPRIRRATALDLDEVVDLWLEIGRHHEPLDAAFELRSGARPEARRLIAAWLHDPDSAAFVSGDARLEGICLVRIDRAPPITREIERAEVTDVGVRPEFRRAGLGRALVGEALAWVSARGVGRVAVRVAKGNPEGQAFWRALGFGDFVEVLHRTL